MRVERPFVVILAGGRGRVDRARVYEEALRLRAFASIPQLVSPVQSLTCNQRAGGPQRQPLAGIGEAFDIDRRSFVH